MASILENCEGFDWDEGNSGKNWHRYRVTDAESEEIFSNEPIVIIRDSPHSRFESVRSTRRDKFRAKANCYFYDPTFFNTCDLCKGYDPL